MPHCLWPAIAAIAVSYATVAQAEGPIQASVWQTENGDLLTIDRDHERLTLTAKGLAGHPPLLKPMIFDRDHCAAFAWTVSEAPPAGPASSLGEGPAAIRLQTRCGDDVWTLVMRGADGRFETTCGGGMDSVAMTQKF